MTEQKTILGDLEGSSVSIQPLSKTMGAFIEDIEEPSAFLVR